MQILWAKTALTPDGWVENLRLEIAPGGEILSATPGAAPTGESYDILLPAPTNLHSHAFQRAMAGLTEARGPNGHDSFWTWRALMYRFLDVLSPKDVQAITAFAQMEMLEAGFAALCEFHYLHHRPGGGAYDDIGEMAARVAAAAGQTGIGLTLIPVLYQQGGCDGRALAGGQVRFGTRLDDFARLLDRAEAALTALNGDARLAVSAHSLRAVSPEALRHATEFRPSAPFHMHLAEQIPEVEEVEAAWRARPVNWLFGNADVNERWCLIHCTQMQPEETEKLARSGAVAGLCPVTEASLGDGIFDGVRFAQAGGVFGVGTDSNIRISLAEELRQFEYSQRLRDHGRAMLATPGQSTGRRLWQGALAGGAQAAGRKSGAIAPGYWADLVALKGDAPDLIGRKGDTLLDSVVFAGADRAIRDVWSAGRHVVTQGRHRARDEITTVYATRMADILGRI